MGVELQSIDASELHFAIDSDAATATHSGAVNHDGIEGCDRLDLKRFRDRRDRSHHRNWSGSQNGADIAALFDQLFQSGGDEAVESVASVIRTWVRMITFRSQLRLKNDILARSPADDRRHAVAGFTQCCSLRINDRSPDAPAHKHGVCEVLDLSSSTKRSGHIDDSFTLFEGTEFLSGRANHLHDQGDRSWLRIRVRNRQWN